MISLESIILLAVIGLVLFIDKFFSKKPEYVNGEIVIVSNNKKKNYFALDKSNIVYWFPLTFLIIGLFISDDINLSIYELTGLIYDSLVAWLVIFYYVTFFTYKSISIVKTKKKIIATEILYFFTIVLLASIMHFSAMNKQNSDDRFITRITSSTNQFNCATGKKNCPDNDPLCNLFTENINCNVEIDTIISRDYIEITKIHNYKGKRGYWEGSDVKATITTEYIYDYQAPLIDIDWYSKVELSNNKFFETPAYFIPFLLNLLILGYIWRFIFFGLFWSIKILIKE